jgi:hypothetical protein
LISFKNISTTGSRCFKFVAQFNQLLTFIIHHSSQRIYKADGDARLWEWLAMVSPCVNVLRNLASRMNDDLGARQGKKHSTPDMKKDIDILMSSLAELEVYVEKEGRTLDPDGMPVPDAISVGLADLAHGSALADFNAQFERNREHHRIIPILSFLDCLNNTDSMSSPSPTRITTNITPFIPDAMPDHPHPSHVTTPASLMLIDAVHYIESPDAAKSSDNDEGELPIEDNVTAADFKPQSFSLKTEANVAMDMDSVIQYFEDDEYPWEDMFGEYKSDSGSSTDHDEADYESD